MIIGYGKSQLPIAQIDCYRIADRFTYVGKVIATTNGS